ncbi:MAG: outer membrane beta-barrel protein, partial [Flavisolibacter sp.]
FKLSKTLTAEISGWYRTGGIEGVVVAKPLGQLSIGFSQQMMKGNGTLRFNIRDIFYTQGFQGSSKYGNVDAAFQEKGDSRVANIGFTYRFNKGKVGGGPKRRGSSANDEQSRVGVGGN